MAPPRKGIKPAATARLKPSAPASHPDVAPTKTPDDSTDLAEKLRLFNSVNPPKPKNAPLYLAPTTAWYLFFAVHLIAALYSPIADCDEVFNYYEPAHYLTHGYGLQTWEYSPEYAIRSWAYVAIHAVTMSIGRLVPFASTKIIEFYLLRVVLGAICALCEARLYSKISKTLNPRVGLLFALIIITSPGMFHASVSFLPSSFAMYATMLGIAAFMDWRGGLRTAQGIWAFGVGATVGWPFAAAMIVPFALEEWLLAILSEQGVELGKRTMDGLIRTLLIMGLQGCIDGFFYQKFTNVAFNIVWYNVIAARAGKGPNIYGVEPWHFYIRNLLLNFNLWFIIALASMPLLLFQHFVRRQAVSKQSWMRGLVFLSPFYLWLAIFTVQPHKEERFMYPAYPALALNAAVGLHVLLTFIGSSNPRSFTAAIPVKLRFGLVTLVFMAAVNIGLWRTLGTITAYGAPLSVYKPLREPGIAKPGDTVCLGKEWYRFPSSFHLPTGVKAKFIKSEFTGLLPGEFSEARGVFGLFPGAHLVPVGMNDENLEDPGKYTQLSHCTFLVDSSFPGVPPSTLEPDYIQDSDSWEQLACQPYLDASQTGIVGRLGWVPDWDVIPAKYRRKWGEYCLLRRKKAIR